MFAPFPGSHIEMIFVIRF